MDMFRHQLNTSDSHVNYDFFQPLENLYCSSLAYYFLKYPENLQQEIDLLDGDTEMAKSLIEEFTENSPSV